MIERMVTGRRGSTDEFDVRETAIRTSTGQHRMGSEVKGWHMIKTRAETPANCNVKYLRQNQCPDVDGVMGGG